MPRSTATQRQVARDFGTCLNFNGTSGHVTAASITGLTAATFTVSVWVNMRSFGGSDFLSNIVSKETGNSGYVLRVGTRTVNFAVGNGGSFAAAKDPSPSMQVGRWYFLTGTYDGTNIKVYLDGVLKATAALGSYSGGAGSFAVGQTIGLGRFANGLIDDVRYYDTALTVGDILSLYTGQYSSVTNLKLHYKFDEGSGTAAVDSSGTQADGTITDATYSTDVVMKPRTTAGQRQTVRDFGTCLNFAGGVATDRVQFSDSNSLDLTTNLTISCWIKPLSFGTSNAGRLLNKQGGGFGYDFLYDGTNKTLRAFFNNTLYPSSQAATITLGQWQHVAMTFDSTAGSNQIKFYVNGLAAGTATRPTAITANTAVLAIGNNESSNRSFDGKMDEFKIYNSTLTSGEISNEYYGINQSTSGLVLYTKFNEGSGTSAIDSSVTQADGTITDATYSTDVVMKPRTTVV